MALIEVVTDEPEIRRTLAALGLPYEPVSFAPPRDPLDPPARGPPPPGPDPLGAAAPSLLDESGDLPCLDDCQLLRDDDASQVPPDREI